MARKDQDKCFFEILNNEVTDKVKTYEDYQYWAAEGVVEAKEYVEGVDRAHLNKNDLKEIHRIAFRHVHPWAGENGNGSNFGAENGSIPERMETELNLVESQLSEMRNKAESPTDKLAIIAFQHLRYISVHQFKDGNGRANRILLNESLRRSTGNSIKHKIDRSEYIKAMKSGFRESNLSPLMKVLAGSTDLKLSIPQRITPEFKIRSVAATPQETRILSAPEELERSRDLGNSFKEHDITKQKCRWLESIPVEERGELPLDYAGKRTLLDTLNHIDLTASKTSLAQKILLKNNEGEKLKVKKKLILPLMEKASFSQQHSLVKNLKTGGNSNALSLVRKAQATTQKLTPKKSQDRSIGI